MTDWSAANHDSVNSSATLTAAIVRSVADREGTDPMALPPLYDSVDVDALARVVASMDTESTAGRVRFSYCGYIVTVDAAGQVTVDDESA